MEKTSTPSTRRTSSHSVAERRTFHVGGAVDPRKHYVIDRSAWHEWLATELVDQRKYLLLHGHRQSGKSSAGVAVDSILSPMSGVVSIRLVFGTMAMGSCEEFWTSFNGEMRTSLVGKRNWYHQHSDQQTADLLDQLTRRDIVDNQTFRRFFDSCHWAGNRVVLLIDEFDTLRSASDDIRVEFLGALRDMKSANDGGVAKPCALVGMLAMGVYHMLQLGVTEANPRRVSPFNVTEVVQPPRPTVDEVRDMFGRFQAEYDVDVAPEIVLDVAGMSSGHVGILSMLGRRVAHFHGELNIRSWCHYTAGGALQGELKASSTVQAMMNQLKSPTMPAGALALLKLLLLAPLEYEFRNDTQADAIKWLLAESIIVQPHAGSGITQFSAEIFRAILVSEFAPELTATMPYSPLQRGTFRDKDGVIDLVRAVKETLAYFPIASLTHLRVQKKEGGPCEAAYHFALYALLRSKIGNSGWSVLYESKQGEIRGNLPRLHIKVNLGGERYGIELLVNGNDFEGHVSRAADYCTQLNMKYVLVVNFTTTHEVCSMDRLPANVGTMQIHFDESAATFQVLSLDLQPRDEPPIQLNTDTTFSYMTRDVSALSIRPTEPASPPPAFALVLERAFRGADHAAVLIPQMKYKWWQNGPELARITQVCDLANAVKDKFGGRMEFGKRYEPSAKVFAEDPRIGGQVNDKAHTARPLHSEIDGKEMDTIDNVRRGHDSKEHPYFVLITRREDAPPVGTE